ncbi:MAG: hypothetical protein HMLKMBBP_00367 [Planctomycetes bacterium]|nr:hypothetical protein [Planctomycetota bacterium]
MTQQKQSPLADLKVDTANLHREDVFTDLGAATIRRLLPVKPDGSDDPTRPPIFVGATQVMSQAGPLPISCEIEAKDLVEAAAKFPDAIRAALEQMIEEAREMQRREATRLVVPGQMPGGGLPPAGGGNPFSLR